MLLSGFWSVRWRIDLKVLWDAKEIEYAAFEV